MSILLYVCGTLIFVLGGFFLLASFGAQGSESVSYIGLAIGGLSAGLILLGIGRIIALLEDIAGNTKRSEGLN
ncbi:hypothetical protein [Methylobacterium sp. CM6247]